MRCFSVLVYPVVCNKTIIENTAIFKIVKMPECPTFYQTSTQDHNLASFVYCRMNMSNGPDISPNIHPAFIFVGP